MISYIINFLKRLHHSAGFGIQSPSDYAFVRDVIYERGQYYAYTELAKQFPDASRFDLKLARLIFRVANYAYPHRVFFLGTPSPLIIAHFTAARKEGAIIINDISCVRDNDVVITLDTSSPKWQEVRQHPHLICFDLLYVGIAINRERRLSEYHLVNFY